jgi:hypothetical protein
MTAAQVECAKAQTVEGRTECLDEKNDIQSTPLLIEALQTLLLEKKDMKNYPNSKEPIDAGEDDDKNKAGTVTDGHDAKDEEMEEAAHAKEEAREKEEEPTEKEASTSIEVHKATENRVELEVKDCPAPGAEPKVNKG